MPRLWQIQIVSMAEAIAVIPDFMTMWSNMSFNWEDFNIGEDLTNANQGMTIWCAK